MLLMMLKGTDLAVISVFKALGMTVRLESILDAKDIVDEYYGEGELEEHDRRHPTEGEMSEREIFLQRPLKLINDFGEIHLTEAGGHDSYSVCDIAARFGHEAPAEVVWLTERKHDNCGFIHLTVSCPLFDNESGSGIRVADLRIHDSMATRLA